MDLSAHPSARDGAARKTQAGGERAPGGRRGGGQPLDGRGPGREVSRRPEEATD